MPRFKLLVGLALAVVSSASAAGTPRTIEVMVLGTYHMGNPGLDLANAKADDVLKPNRQRELEALSLALEQFHPTKIMVERIAKTPALIDHRYVEFTPADLGKNSDERYQIAYRIANRLAFKTVYAIDEQPSDGEPDYFPFDKVQTWAKAHDEAQEKLQANLDLAKSMAARIEQIQEHGAVADILIDQNRPERTIEDQKFYYDLLSFGDTEQQPGADLNAMWYLRNAKIFAKLMTVAEPGDRILVVYGAGHNYWLRHFASTVYGYRNVDPTPYVKRAAKRR